MLLEVNNITKSFGEKRVLTDLSLKAESGRALGLLGRNGAGKTTTIRIVMDVFPPDSGEVLFDGKPKAKSPVSIGYLPEERGLYQKKPIGEQLIYFGVLRGMKAADAKKAAQKLLERLEMGDIFGKKLDVLSKGNQQKIQLAATLLCNPDVVILDEPFSGLDPVNAQLLKDIVKEMIAEGKTVLFSSHQMNYIEEFCNDIAIINSGKIVLSGGIKEIKRSFERDRIVLSATPGEGSGIAKFLIERCGNIVSTVTEKDDSLMVKLHRAGDKGELLKALTERSTALDSFSVFEPTLSDIFVKYTEDAV